MNLRILVLHFIQGIDALGGAQSISNGVHPGAGNRPAKSIRKIQGGYLIDWSAERGGNAGLHFVPDAMVRSAMVQEVGEGEENPAPPPAPSLEELKTKAIKAQIDREAAVLVPENLPPGPSGMEYDEHGRLRRINPTPPEQVDPAENRLETRTEEEREAAATDYKPRGRRRGPTPSA